MYLDRPVSDTDLNNIVYYCERSWFLQMIKELGIKLTLLVLKYHEINEEYLICKRIVDTIENSNKNFGTNYPITIEE